MIANHQSEAVIEFQKVEVAFPGGGYGLRDVTTSITRGSFVALVGGSGAGKTTLLKTVNRLIEPTRGDVRVNGRSVRDQDAAPLRRSIGYVFQGLGLFPHMSVGENIGVTPALLGWPAPRIAERVSELIDLVSLPKSFAAKRPSDLSGGQRQRVAIARALASNPPVMLLDEAFGALDPLTRDDLTTAYRSIHESIGLTTVMVTHDIQEALLLSDRIIVVAQGSIAADGTPAEIASITTPPDVVAMMEMPRRQAHRIQSLLDPRESAPHG